VRGKVAVIGAGMKHFIRGPDTMIQEAYMSCLNSIEKGIAPKEIKAAWFGQWS